MFLLTKALFQEHKNLPHCFSLTILQLQLPFYIEPSSPPVIYFGVGTEAGMQIAIKLSHIHLLSGPSFTHWLWASSLNSIFFWNLRFAWAHLILFRLSDYCYASTYCLETSIIGSNICQGRCSIILLFHVFCCCCCYSHKSVLPHDL